MTTNHLDKAIQRYRLKITLIEPMLGTVPKDPDVYAKYIATKAPPEVDTTDEVESVEQAEKTGWTGFHHDKDGYFIFDYQVRGFLKEAGNNLKEIVSVTALKSKIDNFVFVYPRKIRLPDPNEQPFERPLRAMTMQGPRVTVVRSDVVAEDTVIECELRVLKHKNIDQELLETLLEYGQFQGLGQFRNGSFGRFTYELTPLN